MSRASRAFALSPAGSVVCRHAFPRVNRRAADGSRGWGGTPQLRLPTLTPTPFCGVAGAAVVSPALLWCRRRVLWCRRRCCGVAGAAVVSPALLWCRRRCCGVAVAPPQPRVRRILHHTAVHCVPGAIRPRGTRCCHSHALTVARRMVRVCVDRRSRRRPSAVSPALLWCRCCSTTATRSTHSPSHGGTLCASGGYTPEACLRHEGQC